MGAEGVRKRVVIRCHFLLLSQLFIYCLQSAVRILLTQAKRGTYRHIFFPFTHFAPFAGSCVSHSRRPGSSIVLRSLVYHFFLSHRLGGCLTVYSDEESLPDIHNNYTIHTSAVRPVLYARPSLRGLTESPKGLLLSIRELFLSLASCSLSFYLRLHPPV